MHDSRLLEIISHLYENIFKMIYRFNNVYVYVCTNKSVTAQSACVFKK